MEVARALLLIAGCYLAVGLVVGVGFITAGIGRVDPAARGSGWPFRLLVLPGAAALWPIVLRKWMKAAQEPGP